MDGEDHRSEHPDVPAQEVSEEKDVLHVKPISAPLFSEGSTQKNTRTWMESQRRKKKRKQTKDRRNRDGVTKTRFKGIFDGNKRGRDKKGFDINPMYVAAAGLVGIAFFMLKK